MYISLGSKKTDTWEGKVLCIRPSLAMDIQWGALAFIYYYSVQGGERGGRQSCSHADIHT